MVQETMTKANVPCVSRHMLVCNRRLRTASPALANSAHMAITPQAENGVGDVNRSASTTSGGDVTQRAATCTTSKPARATPTRR